MEGVYKPWPNVDFSSCKARTTGDIILVRYADDMVLGFQHRGDAEHQPLTEVGKWLRSVVQGYFNYHAVPGNFASLQRFRLGVSKRWLRVLQRRSQKNRLSWKHITGFIMHWLPLPKILQPYPYLRFDAKHPR